jgi:hypothetical protein
MIFHTCAVVKKCFGCHFDKLRIKVKVKVKLPLCVIIIPTLHEDVWEEQRYISTILDLSTRWK